jgi:pyruvate/2-oxoacid:ferredoxin oxidoreductase alpha subunit
VDLVQDAFDLAQEYRGPVMILADGMIGQMMEPIEWKEREKKPAPDTAWAAGSGDGGEPRFYYLPSPGFRRQRALQPAPAGEIQADHRERAALRGH